MRISKSATLLPGQPRSASPDPIELLIGEFTQAGSGKEFIKIPADRLSNIHIIIDVTAIVSTPIVLVSIQAFDEASQSYYNLVSGGSSITSVGTTVLKLGENMVDSMGESSLDFIPKNVRIVLAHQDVNLINYSVGINYQEN